MMKPRHRLLAALLGGVLLFATGCATGASDEEALRQRSADDRLQSYTTVLNTLRAAPWADEARLELDRAQVWLQRCEALRVDPDQGELLALTLEAVEGQLIQVKSFYARREAEASLNKERQTYEEKMNQINTLRHENEAVIDGQGGAR